MDPPCQSLCRFIPATSETSEQAIFPVEVCNRCITFLFSLKINHKNVTPLTVTVLLALSNLCDAAVTD